MPEPKRRPHHRLTPEERELRGEMILARRLAGQRMAEIAAEFNITAKTAYKALNEARRNGLMERARDFVQTGLLPLALAVYEHKLTHELDLEAARDVLQGLGLVGRQTKVTVEHDVKEDFDTWRLSRLKAIEVEVTPIHAESSTDSSGPSDPGDDRLGPEPAALPPPTEPAPADQPADGEFGVEDGPVQD